jgi:predicted nucleic acid-binding protein
LTLRAFLDANILFTAAYNPMGLARLLFDLQRLRTLVLLSSSQAVEEAAVNLAAKKPAALSKLATLKTTLELFDSPSNVPAILELPEDDLRIFASALAGQATHLLTGDKKDFGPYFGKPQKTFGIHIQTVRGFFADRFKA